MYLIIIELASLLLHFFSLAIFCCSFIYLFQASYTFSFYHHFSVRLIARSLFVILSFFCFFFRVCVCMCVYRCCAELSWILTAFRSVHCARSCSFQMSNTKKKEAGRHAIFFALAIITACLNVINSEKPLKLKEIWKKKFELNNTQIQTKYGTCICTNSSVMAAVGMRYSYLISEFWACVWATFSFFLSFFLLLLLWYGCVEHKRFDHFSKCEICTL